jgi:hypothetical protein
MHETRESNIVIIEKNQPNVPAGDESCRPMHVLVRNDIDNDNDLPVSRIRFFLQRVLPVPANGDTMALRCSHTDAS